MSVWHDHLLPLDPAKSLDESLKGLPAKWAVYAMLDDRAQPIQLLAVKNLRASIRRRLSTPEETGQQKVDYRAIVRHIAWRRVDSAFESDLVYLDAAKQLFPDRYRKIISNRRAWFVQVNGEAPFPRWNCTDEPSEKCTAFGPIFEKGQAARLVETIEDLFDLCRYHNILIQSPAGNACAYKDMHKCPAPCDGSVSMQQYRSLIDWSIRTLTNPSHEIEEQTQRMHMAAAELRFELAEKIRQFIAALKSLSTGDYRIAKSLTDFRYASIQPGPGKGLAKIFTITPAGVNCVACLRGEERELLLRDTNLQSLTMPTQSTTIDAAAFDVIAIAARHLFASKPQGVFIHGDSLTDRAIAQAYRQFTKRATAEPESEDEGVVAELTA